MSVSISIPFCADHPTSTTPRHLHQPENEKKDLTSEINRLKGFPKLPNELISLIISFVHPSSFSFSSSSSSSFPTLLTTSLVSKSFLFPSRSILFHTLTFTDIDDHLFTSSSRTKTLLHLLEHPLCTFKSSVRKIALKQNLTPHRIRVRPRLSSKEWLEPILPYISTDTGTVTGSTTRCFPYARALELNGIDKQTMNSKAWGMFWSFEKKKKNEFLDQITELNLHQTSPRLFDDTIDASNANDFDRILPSLTRLHFVDPVTCPTLLTSCATTSTTTANWKRNTGKITGQLCSTINANILPIRVRIRVQNIELGSIPSKSPFNLLDLNSKSNPRIPTQILDILRVCTKPGVRLDLPQRWEVVTVTVTVNDAQTHTSDIYYHHTYPNPTTMSINPSSNSSLPLSFSFLPLAPYSYSSLSRPSSNSCHIGSTYSRDRNRTQRIPMKKTRWCLTLAKTSTSDSSLGSNASNALDIPGVGGEEEEEVFWDVGVRARVEFV